jgi:hypothetical protein
MYGSYIEQNSLRIGGRIHYFYQVRFELGFTSRLEAAQHFGVSEDRMVSLEYGHEVLPESIRRKAMSEIEAKGRN